ncbi:MAG: amidohydrolase [Candidatus Ancillula sp.]|jgi:predicted amidohydrolase YtcJ|nr:amidohydrolase [Candidatus Ancillula sp.]
MLSGKLRLHRLWLAGILILVLSLIAFFSIRGFTENISKSDADTVYLHGNIYTVDDNFTTVSSMVVKDNKILYVGTDDGARKFAGNKTKIVDLNGKTVIPGLFDNHLHFSTYGAFQYLPQIYYKTKDEILNNIRKASEDKKPSEFIYSIGWNENVWGGSLPNRYELDAVAPNNPIALIKNDGHSLWLNSKALEVAQIDENTATPEGGIIRKDENGIPTGILADAACNLAFAKLPFYPREDKSMMFKLAQDQFLKYGLTSITDAGVGVTYEDVKLIKDLYANGNLKIRDYVMMDAGEDEKYIADGNKPVVGLYDGRLSFNTVKVISDGSFGSMTAWMSKDYPQKPGFHGSSRYTDDELYQVVSRASSEGFQVATHAIGDASISQILKIYQRVSDEQHLKDPRFRIEHFAVSSPEDFELAKKLNVVASIQGLFAPSDRKLVGPVIHEEDIHNAYNFRELLNLGITLSGGSDSPVETPNPFDGIYASTTFRYHNGEYAPQEELNNKLTREEALKTVTIWGAKAQFSEDKKGSLVPDKYADFVILDRDIMNCPVEDIKSTQVLETVIGGETVYKLPADNSPQVWIWTLAGAYGGDFMHADDIKVVNDDVYAKLEPFAEAIGGEIQQKDGKTATISYKDKTSTVELLDEEYIPVLKLSDELDLNARYYKDSNTTSVMFK